MTRAVAYFGTYDPAYPRHAVLIAGLRELGIPVLEFQAALPALAAAQMATSRGAVRLAMGVFEAHARLLAQHRRRLEIDAVVVGYPGHFLVPFGRMLAAFRHTRLVFDPLVSLWDTFAADRGLVAAGGAITLAMCRCERSLSSASESGARQVLGSLSPSSRSSIQSTAGTGRRQCGCQLAWQ